MLQAGFQFFNWIQNVPSQGIPIESSQVQPSVISFSAAISACEKLGQAAEAGRQLGGLVTKDGESAISITGFSREKWDFTDRNRVLKAGYP